MDKPTTPNPLVPKGSLQEYAQGKSNVRIAFFTIAGIHVLFIAVFLIAGCRRDKETGDIALQDTNAAPPFPALTNDTLGISAPPPPQLDPPSNTVAIIEDTNPPIVPEPVIPYAASIEQAPPPPPAAPEYSVVRGDTLGAIAKRNGVSLQALLEANPGVSPTRLKIGQKLALPAGASNASDRNTNGTSSSNGSNGSTATYTVKSGDTLTKIARANGMTLKQLRSMNNLRTDQIRVGQKLKVAAAPAPAAPAAVQPETPVPGTFQP